MIKELTTCSHVFKLFLVEFIILTKQLVPMRLIFASNNHYKISEIQSLIQATIYLQSMLDAGIDEEIEETGSDLNQNALIKARFVFSNLNQAVFADDSGLEIEALNNEPGVYSARYAGPQKNDEDNMRKVLNNLKDHKNRKARFRTIIALIIDGKEYLFEGSIAGQITMEKRGTNGFGYDPIFMPDNYSKTFAEMTSQEKNQISHRAIAVNKLVDFLNKLPQ